MGTSQGLGDPAIVDASPAAASPALAQCAGPISRNSCARTPGRSGAEPAARARPGGELTTLRAGVSVAETMVGAIAGRNTMVWKTPKIVEIAVGMEINAYACAEIA
jgi:coenzyme PQQ precursor peptide PqqA